MDKMAYEDSSNFHERFSTPDLDDEMAAISTPGSLRASEAVRQPLQRRLSAQSARAETIRTVLSAMEYKPTPADRFRASVRKVIQLHRSSLALGRRGVGAEPGIDPRSKSARLEYGHIHQHCVIDIVDYSSVRSNTRRMTNVEFVDFMRDSNARFRNDWAKVRWINIGGISWDVVSALAIAYDLHPLSIEDVISRGGLISSVDYYKKHLFLRVLCHSLSPGEEPEHHTSMLSNPLADQSHPDFGPEEVDGLPRSSSPEPLTDSPGEPDKRDDARTPRLSSLFATLRGSSYGDAKKHVDDEEHGATSGRAFRPPIHRKSLLSVLNVERVQQSVAARNRARHARAITELKRGKRVEVKIVPMCIFLLRDGTVISLHPTPDLAFTAPITARLRHRETGLRSRADASLLVHGLLDLVVDRAVEVVDEYHAKLMELEHAVLLRPSMGLVRDLHVVSGDLILHRRTLEPVKKVVYGLRRYDTDRTAALLSEAERSANVQIECYMSPKAKIYLADVVDHMDYVLTSIEMFSGIAENLINYSFNMASHQMNEIMRRLTLATIILLPLTLLTGYFGMNFEYQWSVKYHSDLFFWEVAIPLLLVLVPLFCLSDIKRMISYCRRRMAVARATHPMNMSRSKRA